MEIYNGNPKFSVYLNSSSIITGETFAEFYGVLLKEQDIEEADFWFKKLYDFVGEEYYQHDFTNIEQTIRENDAGYGWGNDLHEIKKGGLLPAKSDAIDIIGREWYKKLHDTEFWKRK